ncbi:MAG: hypothetical protein IJ814_04665 [Paludibacteraceae bacterium]|nr:hypothetical protein [Paludibacteraceae bacterium]
MSEIKTSSGVDIIRGKFKRADAGYFYIRNGKQFYRDREETYQQNQSPRQKWNSAAFAYAHRELHAIESDPALTAQMNADYESALHLAPNGKTYPTAHAWKFNSLLYEYKQSHPFE